LYLIDERPIVYWVGH